MRIRDFIIFIFMGVSIMLFSACDAWDYGEHPQLTAVKKIAEYADSNDTKNPPDANLYKEAGVEIDSTDINATNSYIKTLNYSDVDTTEEIQAVVDNIDAYTNEKPTAKITVASSSVKEGETIFLDAIESSDSDGAIVSYQWKIGDKVVHNGIAYDAVGFHKGRYIIELVVTDDYNATGSDRVSVIVRDADDNDTSEPEQPNQGPEAIIEVTDNNSSITLDGSSSKEDQKRIIKYVWEENSTVKATAKTYTVTTKGTHTVTLTVTDEDDKSDSATKTVTVK